MALLWLWLLWASPASALDVKTVEHDPGAFRVDPSSNPGTYDPQAQIEIYGGKRAHKAPRPLIEFGRRLYTEGPFDSAPLWLGRKNPVAWHLMAYGDWRTAAAYNEDGLKKGGTLATRLNLDVDLKLTATERFHAFFRPLDHGNQFTRFDFGPGPDRAVILGSAEPQTAFFEGDAGAILAGAAGRDNSLDLPLAGGLIPLIFQNGIWLDDAFIGGAFTVPARNSPLLDISNMDLTFFAGFDRVGSAAAADARGGLLDHNSQIYGAAGFIEADRGYWELDYGYTRGVGQVAGRDYHNLSAAFTRRYGDWLSNSLRAVWNFGQEGPKKARNADGVLLLLENSFVTRRPLTLLPYLDLFMGFDKPQSLARDAGAGGILKNTGILFETDGLTGFPRLDDKGQDTYGGALGLEYLFNLDQQLAVEVASVNPRKAPVAGKPIRGGELGFGARWQMPFWKAWIVRADAMYDRRADAADLAGARLELRRKF